MGTQLGPDDFDGLRCLLATGCVLQVLAVRQFLRVADPTHRNGPVSEGWQQRLSGALRRMHRTIPSPSG